MENVNVNLYNVIELGYIPNDNEEHGHRNASIGQSLEYFSGVAGDDATLLLCNENRTPLAMKHEGMFYEFFDLGEDSRNLVLSDAYWFQISEPETITVAPADIYKKIVKPPQSLSKPSKTTLQVAARALLEENLKAHEKSFGMYESDSKKLSIFLIDRSPVFVEKKRMPYSEYMKDFSAEKISKNDVW